MPDVSESFSEIQPGPKRGRPRAFDKAEVDNVRTLFPEVTSERGQVNRCYGIKALVVLNYAEPYQWLTSTPELINAGRGKIRFTLLAELGRIGDEDLLRRAAAEVCRLKPSTAAGVGMIHAWRGRQRPGGIVGLANVVIAAVNRYADVHHNTTLPMVLAALDRAKAAFVESNEAAAGRAGPKKGKGK
jgi:hypothetical protein